MKNSNSEYAVFYATWKRSTSSAWLLENISLTPSLKDVEIKSSYFPKSQLEFSEHNKKTKVLRFVVPEWLWITKVEEAQKWNPNSITEFDQFEKMYATEPTDVTKEELKDSFRDKEMKEGV